MLIDQPEKNDNRRYQYDEQVYVRQEFPVIERWIEPGSKVIDLGCGNGSLMKYLSDKKALSIEGIDIAPTAIAACQKHGLSARVGAIDETLSYASYRDKQFDYAICNVTLQMLMYPELLLAGMKRIAKHQIISFPNFAYLSNRFDLLCQGRMPQPMLYKYSWFNTGHIHQLSFRDFKEFCRKQGLEIVKTKHLGRLGKLADIFWPNLFSRVAVCLCREK